MARKAPQEKKRLSLEKDRRNTYGENSKSSRKAIPRRKKAQRRAQRRIPKQIIQTGSEQIEDLQDDIQVRMAAHATWSWKKVPDEPLGDVLDMKMTRRVALGIVPEELAVEHTKKHPRRKRK